VCEHSTENPYLESAGIVVLHNLARDIYSYGHDVRVLTRSDRFEGVISTLNGISSPEPRQYELPASQLIGAQFHLYATKEDIDDETIVIYPEVIFGNPVGAKRVVRWLLCDVGVYKAEPVQDSYGPDDLVYVMPGSSHDPDSMARMGHLTSLYVNPIFVPPAVPTVRNITLYAVYKAAKFMNHSIEPIHYPDSVPLVGGRLSHAELVELFQRASIFFCYDPYSYLAYIAALCGCVTVINPLPGVSQQEYLDSLYMGAYLRQKKKRYLNGVAYGMEGLPQALRTVWAARAEQEDIARAARLTVGDFLDDMKEWIATETLGPDHYLSGRTVRSIFGND
jgi:hypothetical protein